MELLEGIYSRRSVREFIDAPVDDAAIYEILKAGSWAPSGLNNQPWRFVVVKDPQVKGRMAQLTKYRRILEGAPVAVAVFVDREAMYHEAKDHQAMGACIQNMLLASHALGLGAVWLGEILNRAEEVRGVLEIPPRYGLMAVLALGEPAPRKRTSTRAELQEMILREV